jgi:hypothetical protein
VLCFRTMQNVSVTLSGWRELLARIFKDFRQQENVSPAWLINPATRRRLKLDLYYPEAGVAVRFIGLTAKGQGRRSDWDIQEEEQRDQTRVELCRQHDVQLFLVDPMEEPLKLMDHLLRQLSSASRILATGKRSDADKGKYMPALSAAREQATALRSLLARNPDQMMANLADSWRDREAGYDTHTAPANTPAPAGPPTITAKDIRVDKRVIHERFGPGVITACSGENDSKSVSILFDGSQERTFLFSLVQDKLRPEN